MPKRKAARKQQTRLGFTPIPSSSPAAKEYHPQIRDRASAVTLVGSPSPAKRRKLYDTDLDDERAQDHESVWPTPTATLESGQNKNANESDSEPIPSTQRRLSTQNASNVTTRTKQRRIDFSGVRDPSSFDSPVRLPPSSVTQSTGAGMFSSQARRRTVSISSDDSEVDEDLPSPAKVISRAKSKHAGKVRPSNDSPGIENRPTTRSSQKQTNDGSGSEEIVLRTTHTRRKVEESEDNEDDDDMPTTRGTQRRGQKRSVVYERGHSSGSNATESDGDIVVIDNPTPKRSRAGSNRDTVNTPRSRRLKKRPKSMTEEEKNDLEEDLDFLGPSSDVEALNRTPRGTQAAAKNARQKALEKLKRMRTGKMEEVPDDDEPVGGSNDEGDQYEYEESDNGEMPQNISGRRMFQEDEDDQGFLTDEGDDAVLGIPEGLPLEYTRYASMKPKELFKYAVDWMVQKKINPAFEGADPLYDLTFKKLDDEVRGLAGSKYTSSAWTPRFTLALQSRPDIAYEQIDRTSAEHFMRDKCDACNRGSHPATYQIQFQGKPYYRETLEEIADDNEEDDSSTSSKANHEDDDQPSYDAQGREIAPQSTIFYVGKFCMSNAQTAHALQHWRYHLNEFVVTWLIRQGYCTPERLVERDAWSTKKRRKYANKIVDRMEETGDLKQLWRQFRKNTNDARTSKSERFGEQSP